MRLPLIPTILVATACLMMIALGIWQLGRAEEKTALLARYGDALEQGAEVDWPNSEKQAEQDLYRRARVDCLNVLSRQARAGTAATGASGWAHEALCAIAQSSEPVPVQLGWSRRPDMPAWEGGAVSGWIAPGPRLVADPAQAGLAALARPDPGNLPNNHLSYAVQWFLFAITALVVYMLALRRQWR